MEDIVVTKEGVTKLLKGLNPSKALGPDELHPRVLKELATELGPIFAHLFQQSIDSGDVPKEWTLANISPLFKKGDRSLACNYRPVSLTCVPCKLLEHIVCSNIMAHLDEHKLLSGKQHAFRKWHSCETQLATVINDWAKILDNKGQVDTFILDFKKAFDTPPHELLKSKLFSYGIGGKTLKWINAFLCYGQQRVVVNGVKSDWAPVVSGVPQGTVLGPLLFSLHINDITADIESEIRLFADDCVCYREIKDKEDTLKLQREIDWLGNWARKWGMRFQPVKCNMMQLTIEHLVSWSEIFSPAPKMWRKQLIKVWCVQSWSMEARSGTPILISLKKNMKRFKIVWQGLWPEIMIMKLEVWLAFSDNWNLLRKGERIIDSYCYTKVWKVKPRYLLMTLSPRLGVAGISTPWPFRYPQPVKMFICIASSPRLSGTGMTSLNPWFLPLNCQMIAYLSSPLLWELGTNFPQSQPLVKDCQFGVSPVNYSDSDNNISCVIGFRGPDHGIRLQLFPLNGRVRIGCTFALIVPCFFVCKTASSCAYSACYTILNRTLHKCSERLRLSAWWSCR